MTLRQRSYLLEKKENKFAKALAELKSGFKRDSDLRNGWLAKGTWDYDPYMHGLANGLIMARSIMRDTMFDFLSAPSVWGKDLDCHDCHPVAAKGH